LAILAALDAETGIVVNVDVAAQGTLVCVVLKKQAGVASEKVGFLIDWRLRLAGSSQMQKNWSCTVNGRDDATNMPQDVEGRSVQQKQKFRETGFFDQRQSRVRLKR
jgi:hypothetical protein